MATSSFPKRARDSAAARAPEAALWCPVDYDHPGSGGGEIWFIVGGPVGLSDELETAGFRTRGLREGSGCC